jgi:signal transduction histidine kinase
MLRAVPRRTTPSRGTLVAIAVIAVTLLGWYVVVLGIRHSATIRIGVPELGRNVTSGLFITAGVARLASSRLTRNWDAAGVAVALLAIGTALPAASLFATIFADGTVARIEAPESDVLAVLPLCLVAMFLGMRNRHRLASAGVIMVGTAAAVAALAAMLPGSPTPDQHFTSFWVGGEALSAGAWTALAYVTWTRRRLSGATVILSWGVVAALLMTGRSVLRTWSLVDASTLHGLGSGLGLCAGAILLVNALRTLHTEIRQRILDDELGQMLLVRSDRIDELEQAQRARLHDARSVVLGVKGASALLARNASAPADLDAILAAELDRLHALLEADAAPRPCAEFDVRDAVLPVLTTHRLAGVKIRDSVEPIQAIGRPIATATIVDNLLRNAARHAPGSNVHVSVFRIGDVVEIVIEDDGPGIPADDRARMMLPGVSGADAPAGGNGLGLYNSMCAMSAQNGSMELAGSQHGGTRIVLGLPAAMRTPAAVAMAGR